MAGSNPYQLHAPEDIFIDPFSREVIILDSGDKPNKGNVNKIKRYEFLD